MRIAYLLNTYPATSQTFIRNEIADLERLGVEVLRVAVRPWDTELVSPDDIAEQARTRYLLTNVPALLLALLAETLANPRGIGRVLATALRLWRAGGRAVAHAAYLLEAARLKRLLAAERVAHVHVHFTTNACAVAMLSRLMGGPPFSVTAHGPAEFYDRAGQSLDLKVRHAAFVVAISHFAKTRVLQAAGMEAWDKVHVVRLGVDLDAFALQPAPDRDAPFVTVGRLCLNKAQALIPAAVARAAERHPAIRVALIGGGEHETLVRGAIARHGVGDRVEMLGWRAHAEVRERMAGARALLLPSFAEGIPVVIMEALALGRPVISTYIAGIPELVTPDCGWLVPPGDAEALGRALDAALATPPERLAEMGRAGRARVARLHDRHRSAAAMHALFAEAVEGAAAG